MKRSVRSILLQSACILALSGLVIGGTPAFAQEAGDGDISSYAAKTEPPAFDSADAAVDAFKSALAAGDVGKVADLLGLDQAKLKGDEDAMETFKEVQEGAARQLVVRDIPGTADRKELQIGAKLWPLPFPLVKVEDGKWAFDTFAGLEEIVNRRVGENELEAIATLNAYVDAQEEYASEDRDDDGVEEFAQKLISSEGTTDGLYWPPDDEHGVSPAGDALDQAELDDASKGEGYFGYRFRILTGQGDNVAGGAYDYVINGNMIAGFAAIAWPARYGETGIHTFMVNQHGTVYQADLGEDTEAKAAAIKVFNPDDSWEIAED